MKRMKKAKKTIGIILAAVLAANIAVVPVLALPNEGNSNAYIWDFTKMEAGNVGDITLSVNNGTVTSSAKVELDGSDKVLQWKNSNYSKQNAESVMTLDIPDIELDNEKIVIEFTMKGSARHMFGGFPALVGTVNNPDETKSDKITGFGFGKYSRGDNLRLYSNNNLFAIEDATKSPTWNNSIHMTYVVQWDHARDHYYDYRFVIDSQAKTFRFYNKRSTASEWTEPFNGATITLKNSDKLLINNGDILTGDLPDTLTKLRFTIVDSSAKSNELSEETIHKFKSIKVEKLRLGLDGTNIPDGENSLFGEKDIKLDFNYPVSQDTLADGIKLFEDGTRMDSSRYTLEVDSTDNTVVWVKLNEFPQYGPVYEVKINDNLNKNKTGFIKADEGYSKTISFHNEQRTDLSIVSTTPEDGEIHTSRKIKLDFSSSVNMDSAKEQITVWKEDTQLELNTDYTLSFETNDETIIYVNLAEMPDMSTDENRIYYKVKVGTQLNEGKVGYAIFPVDYEEKTISFYNIMKPGKTDCETDFTQYDEITDVSGVVLPDDTPFVIGADGEENALIWSTRNGSGSGETLISNIEFDERFDVMEGPVELEFTARIPKSFMNVKVMGKNVGGATVEFDKRAGIQNWSWTDGVRRSINNEDTTNCEFKLNGNFLDINKASTGYISYKFVIDAASGIIKFFAKEEGAANWTEQFTSYTIRLNGEIDNITGIQFEKSIGKPADKGGSPDEMISWYIKDIKVTQVTTPAITSSTLTNAATDVSDELESIEMGFNTTISSSGISKENITLVKIERGVETPVDGALYDVAINPDKDGIIINFNDELGMDKKYRLKIKDIVANTEEEGKMTTEKIIEFETAKKYELIVPTISYDGAGISLVGDLRTYYKASGENYVIMAALVNSQNEFCDVEYITPGAVPQTTNGFNPLTYNLTLAKPDDFNPQDYSVRLYAIDALSNSESNCKMIELPIVSE